MSTYTMTIVKEFALKHLPNRTTSPLHTSSAPQRTYNTYQLPHPIPEDTSLLRGPSDYSYRTVYSPLLTIEDCHSDLWCAQQPLKSRCNSRSYASRQSLYARDQESYRQKINNKYYFLCHFKRCKWIGAVRDTNKWWLCDILLLLSAIY